MRCPRTSIPRGIDNRRPCRSASELSLIPTLGGGQHQHHPRVCGHLGYDHHGRANVARTSGFLDSLSTYCPRDRRHDDSFRRSAPNPSATSSGSSFGAVDPLQRDPDGRVDNQVV